MIDLRSYNYDVAVVGGGSAGVAAALAASRTGAKTILIERNPYFGGEATNSQVTAYCGFYTRGEKPDQVVKGIGEEVLAGLRGYGANTDPTISKSTGNASIRFNPELVKLVLDDLMLNSTVKYLLHASVIDVKVDSNEIKELTCIDDEGHFSITAKTYIDATGNGNLVNLSGVKTLWGNEEGLPQQSSLAFKIDNLPRTDILMADLEAAIKKGKEQGIKGLEKEKGMIIKIPTENYGYCTIPSKILKDLSAETLTEAEISLRKQVYAYYEAFKNNIPAFKDIRVSQSGPSIGIREARRIIGEKTLIGEEIIAGPKSEDSIARGGWSPEIHRSNTELKYTHIPDNDYFSIPLGTLKVKDMKNLWAAGRLISTDSTALGSIRVMGTGFATGQAAGVAAALTLGSENYDIKKVQDELLKQNALI